MVKPLKSRVRGGFDEAAKCVLGRVSVAYVADELTPSIAKFSFSATQAKYCGTVNIVAAGVEAMSDLFRKISLNEFVIIWLHPANLNE